MSNESAIAIEMEGPVAHLRLNRAAKRNALNNEMVNTIGEFFSDLPAGVGAVVIHADGDHFSAGLDLSSLGDLDAFEGMLHSRSWHEAFAKVENGRVPVIAVLKGAVVGGGLELAAAAHIRVAERSTFYALPEGRRGLFVGGGASVRVPEIIGAHRMADMMLTGRVLSSDEGQAFGLSNYLVDDGAGLEKALELAGLVVENTPVTNFGIINALPRIAKAHPTDGYLMESMISAIAQSTEEAKARMQAFLDGRAAKVREKEASDD